MNQPWIYMYSPSRSPLPPPSLPDPSADSLPPEPPGKPMNTGVGTLSLLQGIFPTQESNSGPPTLQQIPYQLSYQVKHDIWSYQGIPFIHELSEHSLEGLMLKLKLQYFGHLMQRADSWEKTLMLGKIEGRRRRGGQRMRWLDGITDSMDMS